MPEETNVDDKGKMEIQLRILGNELVAIKMSVDDFKMKCILGIHFIWLHMLCLRLKIDFNLHIAQISNHFQLAVISSTFLCIVFFS